MPLLTKWQLPFFKRHSESLERTAVIQGLLLMSTGGMWQQDVHRFLVLGCVAYWLIVLFIMFRHEDHMTKADRTLLNWGFFPTILAFIVYAVGFAHL